MTFFFTKSLHLQRRFTNATEPPKAKDRRKCSCHHSLTSLTNQRQKIILLSLVRGGGGWGQSVCLCLCVCVVLMLLSQTQPSRLNIDYMAQLAPATLISLVWRPLARAGGTPWHTKRPLATAPPAPAIWPSASDSLTSALRGRSVSYLLFTASVHRHETRKEKKNPKQNNHWAMYKQAIATSGWELMF